MRKIRNPELEIALPGFEVFHDEFLASRKEELLLLKAALSQKDFKTLAEYGHKWKGFSKPYGFQQLETLSIELEQVALNLNAERCEELLNEIEEYLGN